MADDKKKPTKKVATQKTSSGAQQYTSAKAGRSGTMSNIEKYAGLAKKAGGDKAVRMLGRAAKTGTSQYGARDLANKVSSSYNAKKRVGKPRGGR